MTHHHLGFHLSHGVNCNTNDNQDRCTAQCDIHAADCAKGDGQDGHKGQENRTDEGNLADNFPNKVGSGFSRRILLEISMGLYWTET